MSRSSSVAARAAMALVLMVGFYVLALAIVALLLLGIYVQLVGGRLHIGLTLVCGVGAVTILISIFPRSEHFDPPWPKLSAENHPELFARLTALAGKTGQEMPGDVYLMPEVNAWVANRGGVMGFGGRRVMGIGFPLLQFLNVSQLEAVIAHEFGHYHGGDTRLGPLIYKTRAAIGRTLANLAEHSSSLIEAPFRWYGTMFLRITQSVSRQQEYTADAFAARTVGAAPLIEALKRVRGYAGSFEFYWEAFVLPILSTGHRPAVADGYARLVGGNGMPQFLNDLVEHEMKEGRADPYDTHPALGERLAALEGLSDRESEDPSPALSLLGEVAEVEWLLIGVHVRPDDREKLKEISWEDVGEKVYLYRWRKMQVANPAFLAGLTASRIPEVLAAFSEYGPKLLHPDGTAVPEKLRPAGVLWALASGLAIGLHDAGWELHAQPGDGVFFKRQDVAVDPEELIDALVTGALDENRWRGLCAEHGLSDIPLWPQ